MNSDDALRELAERQRPSPDDSLELLLRVHSTHRGRRRHFALSAALGGLAMAAAALFVVGQVEGPESESLALASDSTWSQVSEHVSVLSFGQGTVASVGKVHDIAWHQGVLEVDVQPESGVDLTVTTEDATLRVVGTHFTVDKQLWGTQIRVTHGKVEVVCDGTDQPLLVLGGASQVCYGSAAGGLGHAQTLLSQGGSVSQVLTALDRAAAHPTASQAERVGIRSERVALLSGQVQPGDCASSLRWLDALVELGERSAAVPFVQCTAQANPQGFDDAVERASLAPLSADDRAAIQAMPRPE